MYLPLSLQTASEAGARTAGPPAERQAHVTSLGCAWLGPKNEDLTTSQSPSISHPRPGSRAGSWEPWSQAGSFAFCFSLRSCESLFVCNDWKNKIAVTNNENEFFPKGECLLGRGFPMSYWQKPPEQTKATDGWMDGIYQGVRAISYKLWREIMKYRVANVFSLLSFKIIDQHTYINILIKTH